MKLRRYLRFSLPLVIIILLLFLIYTPLTFISQKSLLSIILAILLFSLIILIIVYITIERPLQKIQSALDSGNTAPLQQLRASKNRFNKMADLVIQSFEQRERLSAEISERKTAVRERTEKEKQYRTLFETAPEAIICIDSKGHILLNNQQASELFKKNSNEKLTNENISDYILPETRKDTQQCILTAAATPENTQDRTCIMINGDGIEFPAQIRTVGTELANDTQAVLVYIQDLTSQKAAEKEKTELEEKLRESYKMEAIGQLAGGIAHDYNNIHGAISGYADLISQCYTDDARLKKFANMILSASKRASELTKKLLTFARRNELNLEHFNAVSAIDDVAKLLEHTIDKSIAITLVDKINSAWIYGDTILLQNAIVNLALNARDAMPEGGQLTIKTATTTIKSSYVDSNGFNVAAGDYYTISLSDTGCGIDETTKRHLFEPFFTTKDNDVRTGLGLASVYGTVKSHRGFISVASEPGKGTTFTIHLPLIDKPIHSPSPSESPHKGNAQVMLVDDENFLRDALREMLTFLGYTVTVCASGQEALSFFKNTPDSYDLVILDMKMPEMSGLECFAEMKKIRPNVRALLSTGYSVEEIGRAHV